MKSNPLVGIQTAGAEFTLTANHWSQQLQLPCLSIQDPLPALCLWLDHQGLALQFHDTYSRRHPLPCRVRVDFVGGALAYRRTHGGREQLLKAIGHQPARPLQVLDGTGGLGRDSFLMAAAGCQVDLYEQNPIVMALLRDGLSRALASPTTATMASRLTLHAADCCQAFQQLSAQQDAAATTAIRPDVVYLDPMFPGRDKSAKVKKEMQALQHLLAPINSDPALLLTTALAAPVARIVVKRPNKAPCLTPHRPSYQLTGKTTRFDVYLSPKWRRRP